MSGQIIFFPRRYDDRPDLYGAFGDENEADMRGDWSWGSFAAGAVVGLVTGVLVVAIPAIILAWVIL